MRVEVKYLNVKYFKYWDDRVVYKLFVIVDLFVVNIVI